MEKRLYPLTQRRLRTGTGIRELTASVRMTHRNFIQPLFVEEGATCRRAVAGLNEVPVDTPDTVLQTISDCLESGITKFLLFPVPAQKTLHDFDFSFAAALFRAINSHFGHDIWVAADLCLCSYTTHGHCGILNEDQTRLVNHSTVDVLSRYALQLAQAGADCIAPSDMMDGRIGAIRTRLDAMGFDAVSIMSYAAKFSSRFYGPFRDACHSTPAARGMQHRRSYQVSPLNPNDAIASALRDEKEGADILMVKPALLYTDIIAALREVSRKPVAAYHVSGEYAAIEGLAAQGLADRGAAHLEVWAALTRAGADIIISYAARHARTWIEHLEY